MKETSIIKQLLNIEPNTESELELNSGFLKGLRIDVNFKDRLAMEAINDIVEKKPDATFQDILDVANDMIVWIGWFAIMKKNMIGEDGKEQ